MGIRAPRRSTIALAAAAALASTGSAYVGARNLLSGQADQARQVIPKSWDVPPRADGVYSPGGGPVETWHRGVPFDLHLMVFGDSTATGYGCAVADEVPGVLIARGLAEESGKRIRLSTKAIVGATSKGLSGQIDAMFVAGPPPDAAVIMIGANDITAAERHRPVGTPAGRRGAPAARQRRRRRGRHLPGLRCHHRDSAAAAAGWPAVAACGWPAPRPRPCARRAACPVPFSDLLAPEFRKTPELLFSPRHVPSVGGRICAGRQAVAACAVKRWASSTVDPMAKRRWNRGSAEGSSLLARVGNVSRLWRRSTGVPAPDRGARELGSL